MFAIKTKTSHGVYITVLIHNDFYSFFLQVSTSTGSMASREDSPNLHNKSTANNNTLVSAQIHTPPPPPPKTASVQKKTRVSSKRKQLPEAVPKAPNTAAAAMV